MRSASSISLYSFLEVKPSHTVSLPNYQEEVSMLRESLENLGLSRSAEKHVRIVFAKEAREGPNAEDEAERLITCHQPGVAGEVAQTSFNT